ncbi:MAG TPA: oligopeptide-binding protein oppA [Nitrospinae bacterium]|nr:oligopeptide-binding protein oppA [Nitrospinota bacterium]HBA25961.1 oligopeptide-binding protein oppA [Nitrospinota bacterium]
MSSNLVYSKTMKIKICITAFFILIFTSCNIAETKNSNIFRMSISTEPPTLDWSLATDGVSFNVIASIMEGLTEFDEKLNPKPAIASKWDVSGDGKIYTFYLRKDVFWTDGKPVTAYDFEYSWKRLLNPQTAAEYAYFLYDILNAYEYNSGKIKDPELVGIKAISPGVLEVRLKKPIVYFPSITTFMVTFPQRKDIIEKYGDRWTEPENIITNGPFKLTKWRHEYQLILKANEKYYNGKPKVNTIKLFVVNERNTALTLYETGDLDMVSLPPEAIPSYREKSEYKNIPLLRGYYYGFNVHKKPFDDGRIRRGFAMAINKEELPRILNGGEIPTDSWISKDMLAHNPKIGVKFNPEEAKRILSNAGFPNGKGLPPITLIFNTDPVNSLIAENVQFQWKRNLNVEVKLDNQEWKVFLKRLKTDTPAVFRLGWGADYPDPDNFMTLFTTDSGNNNTGWSNKRYDELINMARGEGDREKRINMYDEAQRILLEEDIAIIPLFFTAQNVLIKPYVKGLRLDAMELLYLKKLKIERH